MNQGFRHTISAVHKSLVQLRKTWFSTLWRDVLLRIFARIKNALQITYFLYGNWSMRIRCVWKIFSGVRVSMRVCHSHGDPCTMNNYQTHLILMNWLWTYWMKIPCYSWFNIDTRWHTCTYIFWITRWLYILLTTLWSVNHP